MDVAARAYVYNHESESYTGYVAALTAARDNLSSIETVSDAEMSWRIERLRNMIDYYHEPLIRHGTSTDSSDTYATYNLLNYRAKLIARTETSYYGFFTDFMARSRDAFQMHWQRQRMIQFIVLFGIIALAIVVSFVYTQRIYDPIRTLVSNTERIKQGNYQLEQVNTKLKELTILADASSNMAESIKGSFDMLKENARLEVALLKQENDNLEMRNLVTETELRSLQAQINPHFVFNTLSMISKSAYASGDTDASELMEKLSEFLRYATEKANKNSTLYEELESIKLYLHPAKAIRGAHPL